MRRFLHIDEVTGEVRLVMADLDEGVHSRTEFRLTGSDGVVLRGVERWGHMDGAIVAWDRGLDRYYVPAGRFVDRDIYLTFQEPSIGPVEKSPCKLTGKGRGQRRCPFCEAGGRTSTATTTAGG
jgi:hypothetical protein